MPCFSFCLHAGAGGDDIHGSSVALLQSGGGGEEVGGDDVHGNADYVGANGDFRFA